MKHQRVLSRGPAPLLTLLLSLAGSALPLSAQTGQVTGRAVQAESSTALAGAEIRVSGTSIVARTGPNGRYLISRAPVGQQTLELSYLGRETVTQTVTVRDGEVSIVDFQVDVAPIAVEGINVLGARAMTQARALSEQKNAPNIINVVAADQIGRFPDASAPEALQRIPGITVERDQGEGRYINIRGGASDFTNINLNGASIPPPEGDERRVALDAVPVDILESIEVAKALTPDMDAQGIGGAVNLVTKKAPEQAVASLDLGAGYAPIREEPSYEGVLTLGQRFGEDSELGVLFLGSYSFRDFGSDDVEPEWDFGDPGLGDDELTEFQTRHYSLTRQRIGGTASLDYRFSPTSQIQFTGTYTEHEDTEQRRRLIHVIEDDELEFNHKNRRENLQIASGSLDGDHLLGNGLQLGWGLSLSRSAEDTPFDNEIAFLQEDVTFSPNINDPERVLPNPASGALSGPFEFDKLEAGSSKTTDTDRMAHVDLEIPYSLGENATGGLKFGFLYRDKSKDQSITEDEYELSEGDLFLGQGIGESFDFSGFVPGNEYGFVPSSTTPDEVRDFQRDRASALESERNIEADSEDFDLNESVIGGYVMTELNLSESFMIMPGVRYEYTDMESDGFEFDSETEALTPTSSDNTYGNLFPHLHLRYRAGPQTNIRAAYSSAIARPNYFSLIPYRIRDDEDIEIGNPDLDPTTANNLDLLVEHYDSRIGVLSAGVFYKSITDPIFSFVEDNNLGGDTEQPRNGESANLFGIELAVQQQLNFLPGRLGGLGIYANYTFTDSEGTLPDGRTANLAGQADHAFNTALSYEWGGFSGQLGFNFRDSYVDAYGEEEAEDEFVGSRHQIDFSASYDVHSQGTIYVELLNLTNQPFVLYQGFQERERQREFYRAWGTIGVRINR
jgi:TonB-dependent receptor